jgi:hypothetical protein
MVTMLVLSMLATSTRAQLWNNLNGNIDMTAVQSELNGDKQETLRQEYTASWYRNLTSTILVRGAFRYYNFDLSQDRSSNVWQKEYQPSGELVLNHIDFVFNAGARRRVATSTNIATNQTSDNLTFSLKSKSLRYPLVTLRYDWDHIFTTDVDSRDTRDRRFQAGANYDVGNHNLSYNYTRRFNDNIISDRASTQNLHLFRWTQMSRLLADKRLQLGSSYTFSWRSVTDETPITGQALEYIAGATALYSQDQSPDYDALDTVITLMDGNTANPTLPNINIGGATGNQNVGVDFGFQRSVSAMYLYTDRASGQQVQWQVYVSDDNLTWRLHTSAPAVEFNIGLNRYEIGFATVVTRYVKVVNSGFNDIATVYITEIQTLLETDTTAKSTQRTSTHLANINASYKFSEAVKSYADISYQREPSPILGGHRDDLFYALSTRYRQSPTLSHNFKWQQGFQLLGGGLDDIANRTASYTLLYTPLETLDFSLSAYNRNGYIGGVRSSENNSILLQTHGTPVRRLNMSTEISFSRIEQVLINATTDTWVSRVSMDGRVFRSVDATASYSYQTSYVKQDDIRRVRHRLGTGVNYRLSQTIFIRGNLDLISEEMTYISHDYLISWNMTPKLTTGLTARLTDNGNDRRTTRYSSHLNYQVSSRSSIYFSFTQNDFTQAGGTETTSLQAGFRTGF